MRCSYHYTTDDGIKRICSSQDVGYLVVTNQDEAFTGNTLCLLHYELLFVVKSEESN